MSAARRWAVMLLALAGVACLAPPERGYYAPEGEPVRRSIGSFEGDNPAHHMTVVCQGVYQNTVAGEPVRTVHMQMRLAALTSAPVVITARRLAVDLHAPVPGPEGGAGGEPLDPSAPRLGPVTTLRPAEIWSRRTPIQGDLIVEGFSRRSFDLFFDEPAPDHEAPPVAVLLRWQGTAGRRPMAGQCQFVRIADDDPLRPGDDPVGDPAFGLQDGYYLPGAIRLGPRALRPTDEERMHYVFHAPRQGWFW